MIYVFNLLFTNSNFGIKEKKLLDYVSEQRRKRVMDYHFDIDKKLSLYGELMIKMGVNIIKKSPIKDINFSYNSFGKPYLLAEDIYFNLSHTRNYVLCAISTKTEVGVDVEKINMPPYEIMPRFYHKKEIDYVSSEQENKETNFYNVWTKKEAYLKMIGTGLHDYMSQINSLNCPFRIKTYQEEEYICSVCYNQEDDYIEKVIQVTEEQIFDFMKENFS